VHAPMNSARVRLGNPGHVARCNSGENRHGCYPNLILYAYAPSCTRRPNFLQLDPASMEGTSECAARLHSSALNSCRTISMPEGETKSTVDIEADEALQSRLDAEAEADYAAGRTVPHAKVAEWLKSWGAPNPLERPSSKLP
jgi:predicted transcriptional regulator